MNQKITFSIFLFSFFSLYAFASINIPKYDIIDRTKDEKIKLLVIEYESMSADGTGKEKISGLISFPMSKSAKAMLLDNHHTVTDDAEIPSTALKTASSLLFQQSYFIIAPDYLGYGISKDKAHPYLCHEQNAQNAIDLVLVAQDIIKKYEINFDNDVLYNIGYSQGAGVAMAVHREFEKNKELAQELKFSETWCGDGPYDVAETLNTILSNDKISMPVLLPLVIKGFLTGYPNKFAQGRKFSDFFKPELIEAGLETWLDEKNLSTEAISNKMLEVTNNDNSLKAFLNENVLDETSVLRKELEDVALTNNVIGDWTATLPITLFHLMTDEVVPFINAENALESLKLDVKNQYFQDDKFGTHSSYGISFYFLTAFSLGSVASLFNDINPISDITISNDNKINFNEPMYNLQGVRVDKNYRGIIVQKWKKFLLK